VGSNQASNGADEIETEAILSYLEKDLPSGPTSDPPFSIGMDCGEKNVKRFVMNNYFGIGVDAEVALKFHQLREEKPQYFRSR
jgi:hypothetical protein